MCPHDDVLCLTDRQLHVIWQDLDRFDDGIVVGWRLCSCSDPFGEDPIIVRIRFESQSAFVRESSTGLGEDQAATGIRQFDATAPRLLRNDEVIRVRVVTAKAESEAAFAGQSSVT